MPAATQRCCPLATLTALYGKWQRGKSVAGSFASGSQLRWADAGVLTMRHDNAGSNSVSLSASRLLSARLTHYSEMLARRSDSEGRSKDSAGCPPDSLEKVKRRGAGVIRVVMSTSTTPARKYRPSPTPQRAQGSL